MYRRGNFTVYFPIVTSSLLSIVLSLVPDSCGLDTESRFGRWGLKSLLFAKFVPGFSAVAPRLAGAPKQSTIAFLIYDAIGAAVWAGSAVAVGRAFHHAIGSVIAS